MPASLPTFGVFLLSLVILLQRGVEVCPVEEDVCGVRAQFGGHLEILQRALCVMEQNFGDGGVKTSRLVCGVELLGFGVIL